MSECEHDTLNWTQDIKGNHVYWCSSCRKKVVIPFYLLEPVLPTLRAIRSTFGEKWVQIMLRGNTA